MAVAIFVIAFVPAENPIPSYSQQLSSWDKLTHPVESLGGARRDGANADRECFESALPVGVGDDDALDYLLRHDALHLACAAGCDAFRARRSRVGRGSRRPLRLRV